MIKIGKNLLSSAQQICLIEAVIFFAGHVVDSTLTPEEKRAKLMALRSISSLLQEEKKRQSSTSGNIKPWWAEAQVGNVPGFPFTPSAAYCQKPEPVKNPDGTIKQFMIKTPGAGDKHFRCMCGLNVFHKPDSRRPNLFKCNGCGQKINGDDE